MFYIILIQQAMRAAPPPPHTGSIAVYNLTKPVSGPFSSCSWPLDDNTLICSHHRLQLAVAASISDRETDNCTELKILK